MIGWSRQQKEVSVTKPAIFVSYSTTHSDIVRGQLAVLKPIADVYFAEDMMVAGENIKPKLAHKIAAAQKFYLFWCHHASKSEWIAWEIEQAQKQEALQIISICLDRTKLPPPLADKKYVDSFIGSCLPDDLAETMGWRHDRDYQPDKYGNMRPAHGYNGGFPDRSTFDYYIELKWRAEDNVRKAVSWISEDLNSN